MRTLLALILAGSLWAQEVPPQAPEPEKTAAETDTDKDTAAAEQPNPEIITVPAGTTVPLVLKHAISTKSAKVGDHVYLESTFPVTLDDRVVVPAGTYVQGVVSSVKRSGRIKGRAELLLHFTTMIFPNGYAVTLPGALESLPGAETQEIKDEEGTIQAQGTKGRDVATAAGTAATGTLIGAAARGGKGAAVGAGIGGATGLLIGLLSRGNEVRLESGTGVE
ncbi:MAG: hypothetical protein ACRD2R_05360, partial [Terriglobales bacterium]